MARSAVAEQLRREDRARAGALSPAERVARALALGRDALALYCAASGLSPEEARRNLERRAQARRRASGCLEALLG
jgi:hypothetical protein